MLLDPGRHEYGQWCLEVMTCLGLLREEALPPLQVGVSLGGVALLDLATVAPETIRAAALVVPGGLHPGGSSAAAAPARLLASALPPSAVTSASASASANTQNQLPACR